MLLYIPADMKNIISSCWSFMRCNQMNAFIVNSFHSSIYVCVCLFILVIEWNGSSCYAFCNFEDALHFKWLTSLQSIISWMQFSVYGGRMQQLILTVSPLVAAACVLQIFVHNMVYCLISVLILLFKICTNKNVAWFLRITYAHVCTCDSLSGSLWS